MRFFRFAYFLFLNVHRSSRLIVPAQESLLPRLCRCFVFPAAERNSPASSQHDSLFDFVSSCKLSTTVILEEEFGVILEDAEINSMKN